MKLKTTLMMFLAVNVISLSACTINVERMPPGQTPPPPPPQQPDSPPPSLTPQEKADLKKAGQDLKAALKYGVHSFHCHEEHTCDQ